MNSPTPPNELDQAIIALKRSRAAFPELCRSLCKGELFLLMRYHPELVDATVELENGMPFPFPRLQTDQGETVPAYTSVERANEGLAEGKVPPGQFVIGSMPALQALEVIGKANFSLTLNQGCSTGHVILPPELLRDLADGTALKPLPSTGKTETVTLKLMDPANYPTDVVQASFELFRRHANFRAAWMFTRDDTPEAYCMILVMQPPDDALFHDFNLVAQSAAGKKHPVYAQVTDATNPEQIAALFNCGRPFYQAVDYPPPALPKPPTEQNP